jgi:hypothetical protein
MGRLEGAKSVVEILAILGAGTWALVEYGLKASEDRQQGLHLKRAVLQLDAAQTQVDNDHSWVHGRLHLKNVSKRVVTTFLTSWWFTYPGADGTPQMSPIHNDTTANELAPGEESETDHTFVVRVPRSAIVVHAHVLFENSEDGTVCRLVDTSLSTEQVTKMTDQPEVCAGKPGEPCTRQGCPSQAAEQLVLLKGATP